jgi:tetratricopeptide (TPR) repeat protein/transcriptional regulator with XRE-family HTH domain
MGVQNEMSVGQRLRHERLLLTWSQEKLAEKLRVSVLSINRWENDKVLPQPYYREQLCQLFNKSPAELGFISQKDVPLVSPISATSHDSPASTMPIWKMPHRRNMYFTGREDALLNLRDTLTARKMGVTLQICALSGLGGIGKTQVAVEYAYRYADEYAAILWARADSYQSLTTDFVTFVHTDALNLPERADTDQAQIVEAVKRWLQQHKAWLLILDNADDVETVYDFLPTRGEGHILLTTRSQATGPGMKSFEIEKMGREEGALLLLRRAKLIAEDASLDVASESERAEAEAICAMLDGLPLALDQAAAYIEENQSGLAAYQKLYLTHRTSLLKRRGTFSKRDYPQSVATTWSLSFEQLAGTDEITDATAADLLRLCAFFYPDDIPEAMIIAGVGDPSPGLPPFSDDPLLLDDAIGILRRYSLLRRNPETKMLTIHRLVQTVLKDAMTKETHYTWAERCVRVVSRAFPEAEFATWSTCQQYLPHALVAAELIEQWDMQFPEAAQLLERAGTYLLDHAQFAQAEPLYRRALSIREVVYGQEDLHTARSMHALGTLYAAQSKYDQAESLFQRALAMYEGQAMLSDPKVADILTALATLYDDQGRYDVSRPLHLQAVAIYEALPNPNVAGMSECLTNFALHYFDLAEYEQAEPLYLRALAIQEHTLGPTHPGVAHTLHNLASLYTALGKYEQAEPLYLRTLAIREQVLGPLHPRVAATLNNIAILYERQGKFAEAEQFHRRALTIREETLDPFHKDVANSLHNVATCYLRKGEYEQAESLYLRSLAIHEQSFGPDHPNVAHNLNRLAQLYAAQQQYDRAAALFQRALAIQEQNLGTEHLDIAITLERYAELLRQMGQEEQAAPLEQRARTIRAKHT